MVSPLGGVCALAGGAKAMLPVAASVKPVRSRGCIMSLSNWVDASACYPNCDSIWPGGHLYRTFRFEYALDALKVKANEWVAKNKMNP
jgi:hypothetical protein